MFFILLYKRKDWENDTTFRAVKKDPDLRRIEQLYEEYRLPLWRYAYKILHDEHMADDVVQTVFTKAIEKVN